MVTLDTSVLADLFLPVEEERKVKAKKNHRNCGRERNRDIQP
jgi:hypothetical protein